MNDKNHLREQLKTKRAAFQGEKRTKANDKITRTFLAMFGGYESFFIYNSLSSEVDTKRIIAALLKAGKRVYLPRVEGDNMVAVPYGETKKGAFGIEEQCGQAFSGDIEVTVIPLLAVNANKFRIGYGKGYYDKFLKGRHTKKVGLGYSFQITDFCEDEWDIPLDIFLCEKAIYAE